MQILQRYFVTLQLSRKIINTYVLCIEQIHVESFVSLMLEKK